MKKAVLMGYSISSGGLQEDVSKALALISSGNKGRYMACANPHSIVVADTDQTFKKALLSADILVPDGSGVLLAGRVLNLKFKEKVAGTDFFLQMNKKAEELGGLRYFFLGSSETVLNKIVDRLKKEYPSIEVCGTYSPPFKQEFCEEDNRLMVETVNKSKPDVLWVGMTAPKQETWIFQNKNTLDVPFSAAIGAVFDFYAGTKERSSEFWINLGLEWLPRFLKEPIRLWERNLKSTPIFLWWILKKKLLQIRTQS